jgi:hypothetical protein
VGAPVATPPLHVGAAAGTDVVSGLAQGDGGTHVLAAQRTGERLEQAVTHAATGRTQGPVGDCTHRGTGSHSCCNRENTGTCWGLHPQRDRLSLMLQEAELPVTHAVAGRTQVPAGDCTHSGTVLATCPSSAELSRKQRIMECETVFHFSCSF